MASLREIPELAALRSSSGLVRIPPELDVPLTNRVKRLIDTPQFRRLAHISQLGLVAMVYPAANHSRFEHSLGVYRMALCFLDRLADDPQFNATVEPHEAERFLVAALLHDLGHWPFCHPIEDLSLRKVPNHEQFAQRFLSEAEVAEAIDDGWGLKPGEIVELLASKPSNPAQHILHSLLSGPIDVDKMDYLMRDSLHAGVPYGRNFDHSRLIQSFCLNESGDGLAISEKGKTAAEMMVFARYVMFSEVYWHHAVRAATAMLQRAFFLLEPSLDSSALFVLTEQPLIDTLKAAAVGGPAQPLLHGLFGPTRRLYKRVAQYSLFQQPDIYRLLVRREYGWLIRCAENFSELASSSLGQSIGPHEVLLDAPPQALEVQFQIDVHFPKESCYRPLGEVSPVVRSLAHEQFDDYVKRVRLFVHPSISAKLRSSSNLSELISRAAEKTDEQTV